MLQQRPVQRRPPPPSSPPQPTRAPAPRPHSCRLLLNASSPIRTPASDICNKPPFICSPSGRLLRFVAPHAGLSCPTLPDAFSKFSDLVHLDLSNNELGATTQALGRLVKAMPKLQRLLLRYGKVSGQLVCDMAGPQVQVGSGAVRHVRLCSAGWAGQGQACAPTCC
jgi:hypothetical protein